MYKFVCEGLWAVEKLIEKKINVTEFFFNMDKINSGNIDDESLQKIAKMIDYASKSYAKYNEGKNKFCYSS